MSESAGRAVAEVVDALGTGLLIPQWIGDVENPFPLGTKLVPEQLYIDLLAQVRALADEWERDASGGEGYNYTKYKEGRIAEKRRCAAHLRVLTQTPTEAVKK